MKEVWLLLRFEFQLSASMGNPEESTAGEVNAGYDPTEEKVIEEQPPPYSSGRLSKTV